MDKDKPLRDLSDKSRRFIEQREPVSLWPHKPLSAPQAMPPELTTNSPDELAASIQASITEIAVIWMLHSWSLTRGAQGVPLDEQIVNFSATAFDAVVSRFPMLRDAKQKHLWLIYFKGLLTAKTHPYEQMIGAIKAVATRSYIGLSPDRPDRPAAASNSPVDMAQPKHDGLSDAEALEQIGRALGQTEISRA
jgi:hypothetical protein